MGNDYDNRCVQFTSPTSATLILFFWWPAKRSIWQLILTVTVHPGVKCCTMVDGERVFEGVINFDRCRS